MVREVTERDFRRPEFLDAKPEDYEFRSDGSLARKDRWEKGIRSIIYRITSYRGCREFEIENVVAVVDWLMDQIPDRDMSEMVCGAGFKGCNGGKYCGSDHK